MNAPSGNALLPASFLQDIATLFTDLDGLPMRKVFSVVCPPEGGALAGGSSGLSRIAPDAYSAPAACASGYPGPRVAAGPQTHRRFVDSEFAQSMPLLIDLQETL